MLKGFHAYVKLKKYQTYYQFFGLKTRKFWPHGNRSTEETFALTEGEEEEEEDVLNSTQQMFMEYNQQIEAERYDTFCALKNAGKNTGN